MTDKSIIETNKGIFLELLNQIKREGFRKEELIKKLESSDFFTAPASTKYHGSFEGGLCAHSISVYYNLKNLITMKGMESTIDPDTILILGLLHDMSKMNFYKKDYRNKKVYSEGGSKYDDGGRYDWVVEQTYSVIPQDERFLFGNHEETSEYMVSQYVPLSYIESAAIINHHAGMSFDSTEIAPQILQRYPIAALLHIADMLASYIENI